MPKSIFTNVHIHLTLLAASAIVFLTTTAAGESVGTARPMGSFVYAMPNVRIIELLFVLQNWHTFLFSVWP